MALMSGRRSNPEFLAPALIRYANGTLSFDALWGGMVGQHPRPSAVVCQSAKPKYAPRPVS